MVLWIACAGCVGTLPKPPHGTIPPSAGIEVPYPPPSGRVEVVPHQSPHTTAWIDGQWDWTGKSWSWTAGSWVTPEKGTYFTPWTIRRRSDGQLLFEPAAWRTKDGKRIGSTSAPERCALPDGKAR